MFGFVFTVRPAFEDQFVSLTIEKKEKLAKILNLICSRAFETRGFVTNVKFRKDNIELICTGICIVDTPVLQIYMQKIQNEMILNHFEQLFFLSESRYGAIDKDRVLTPLSDVSENINSNLVEIFELDEDKIPQSFRCPITQQIISHAAFLPSNPKVNYEYTALLEWLVLNQTDPLTRLKATAPQMIDNGELQKQISRFMMDYIFKKDISYYHNPTKEIGVNTEPVARTHFTAGSPSFFKSQKESLSADGQFQILSDVMKECRLEDEFMNLLGKSLRRAANAGKESEIKSIFAMCEPNQIINLQDDNAAIKNTALHYAIKKEHPSIIELLLQNGAKVNIENAQGETAEAMFSSSAPLGKTVSPMFK